MKFLITLLTFFLILGKPAVIAQNPVRKTQIDSVRKEFNIWHKQRLNDQDTLQMYSCQAEPKDHEFIDFLIRRVQDDQDMERLYKDTLDYLLLKKSKKP